MKQPEIKINDYEESTGHWVEIYSVRGTLSCYIDVSVAKTEKVAYRKAARKLRKLAEECEKRSIVIKSNKEKMI